MNNVIAKCDTSHLRFKKVFFTILFCLAAVTGYSDDSPEKYLDYKEKSNHKYLYFYANYVDARQEITGNGATTMTGGSEGWGVAAGLSFHRYFAFEVAHHNFGQVHFVNPDQSVDEIESSTNNFGLVAKFPIGRFEPFFKIGLSSWWIKDRRETPIAPFPNVGTVESKDSGTGVFMSYGASYSFMRGFVELFAEAHSYTFEPTLYAVDRDWDLEFYTLGLKFNF